MSHGQNVTVDILIGSKCHSGRSELGRNVQAAHFPADIDLFWLKKTKAVMSPGKIAFIVDVK